MKRLLPILVALAILIVVVLVLLRNSPPPPSAEPAPASQTQAAEEPWEIGPDAVVFDLKYRPLTGLDDPLSYRAFWGFGGREDDDPFVRDVRKQVEECTPVYNSVLPQAQWSVVAIEDGKPVALYFDTDANGKFSADEKFPPALAEARQTGYQYAFATSDFLIHKDGKEVPFRLLLVANRYGEGQLSFMWSPSCVLEGEGSLAGEPMRLFLYADGPGGSFTAFRRSSYALLPAGQKLEGYVPRHMLSSLIHHEGAFYRVRLLGTHAEGESLQVVLTKDTSPIGQLAVELAGKEKPEARLTSAVIEGTTDETVHLNISGAQSTFPVGGYRLSSGYISYGASEPTWHASLSDGPTFYIEADKTCRVQLGGPKLSVRAIEEADRYDNDAAEKSRFANADSVYLEPRIAGTSGETFARFSRQSPSSGQREDIRPHLTIVDADGQQVVATDLEYG